jgi:hypothetical protein
MGWLSQFSELRESEEFSILYADDEGQQGAINGVGPDLVQISDRQRTDLSISTGNCESKEIPSLSGKYYRLYCRLPEPQDKWSH